jgi:hypothetical protein
MRMQVCNDPLISCSGVMFPKEIAHECRDGRRDQALDGGGQYFSHAQPIRISTELRKIRPPNAAALSMVSRRFKRVRQDVGVV